MSGRDFEEKYRNIVSKSIEELEPTDLIDVSYVKQSAEDNKKILEEMEEIERKYYGKELLRDIERTDELFEGEIIKGKMLLTPEKAKERLEEFLERTEEWPNDYKPNETQIKLLTYRFAENVNFR